MIRYRLVSADGLIKRGKAHELRPKITRALLYPTRTRSDSFEELDRRHTLFKSREYQFYKSYRVGKSIVHEYREIEE